jgi:hypothetical protein
MAEPGLPSKSAEGSLPSKSLDEVVLPSQSAVNAVLPSKSPDEVVLPSKSLDEVVFPSQSAVKAIFPSKSLDEVVLPSTSPGAVSPIATVVVLASRTFSRPDVQGEHVGGRAATGVNAGVIVGPLFGILVACGLILFLVSRRRRKRGDMSLSQDANEMTFEVDTDREDNSLSFEDEVSVGSQYANQSDFEAMGEDGIDAFDHGELLEETLFGF